MPLTVIPNPAINPVFLEIGPVTLRWYALSYVASILFGWWYARRMVGNDRLWGPGGSPLTKRSIDDFVIFATIGIVAGGRIGYILVYDLQRFVDNPLSIFALWEGGMSWHGGVAGTVLAMVLFAVWYKVPLLRLGDVIAATIPFGSFIGRIANFINGELYGRPASVPWAMVFPTDPEQLPRHPSQLYQSLMEGLILFIILWLLVYRGGKLARPGFVGGAFLAGYGTARIIGEFFRQPDIQIGFLAGGLTMGMLLSLPMVIAGVALMVTSGRRAPAPPAVPATGRDAN